MFTKLLRDSERRRIMHLHARIHLIQQRRNSKFDAISFNELVKMFYPSREAVEVSVS